MRLVLPEQDICFTPLANDSFDCAVSPESELARKERLTLDDLVGKKVYLLAPNLAQADHIIGKILMQFGLKYDKLKPWRGTENVY